MTCGARTRAGTPCKQKAIYANGRCKFHGGLSTGPKTEAGKEQARINGRHGGRRRKPKP
ncbi:HGGxSTG domain-containing protein [Thiobacillus sp.]